jgi:hypothetical protein
MGQGRVDQPAVHLALANHDARIRALEASPSGGIKFDTDPQTGDWLWVKTTGHETAPTDGFGVGIGMNAVDGGVQLQASVGSASGSATFFNIYAEGASNGGITIQSQDDGNGGVLVRATGTNNGGVEVLADGGNSGVTVKVASDDSGPLRALQQGDGGIDINNSGAGDTVIEQTGTGNVLINASAGANGQPSIRLGGNSNDAPITIQNNNNVLALQAQSGIELANTVSGLALLIQNNASSYLNPAGAEGVLIGNHIELTAYNTEAPTPSAGQMSLYGYDDGANFHLRVKFANGTVVNLATD